MRKKRAITFEQGFERMELRYFKASEFLVMGNGNRQGGRCGGLNYRPPAMCWQNIYDVAAVWDVIREQLGEPISMLSVYRSPAYNKCIGGGSSSQHMEGAAGDGWSPDADAREIYEVALKLRREGVFRGGLGLYVRKNFVHVDVRGKNVAWGRK